MKSGYLFERAGEDWGETSTVPMGNIDNGAMLKMVDNVVQVNTVVLSASNAPLSARIACA